MKTRMTIFLSLGVLGVMLMAMLSTVVNRSLNVYIARTFNFYLLALIIVLDLLLAAAFCAIAWLMLVKDAGDKIPPIVMLILGLAGILFSLANILLGSQIPAIPFLLILPGSRAGLTCALFVAFGVAGLILKPRAA